MITLNGRVDSATAPQFTQVMDNLINKGVYKFVIDMSGLEYMSSAGFRALLSAQRSCKRYNRGEVILASVPSRIQEALELAGFTELFKTYPEPLEAVGSF
jgi:anti-sigma B factor antagonist